MKPLTIGRFKFIKAWKFPKDISKFAEFLMQKYGGSIWNEKTQSWDSCKWTHIFCGESFLGDTRIDINPKKNVTLTADYKDLVSILGEASQENIILDPPWQISPIERMKISYTVRDLLKLNGHAVFNCTWNPWCQGFYQIDDKHSMVYIPQAHFNGYLDTREFWILQRCVY